jgi:osomolarity two-component system sensor histidine kinase NIK1
MSLDVANPLSTTADSSSEKMLNSIGSEASSSMGHNSRTTSTPLPDFNNLPSNFIDHLLLATQALVNAKSSHTAISNGDVKLNGTAGTADAGQDAAQGSVSLPLPRFQAAEADERTRQIEANLSSLAERLWRSEDQLALVSQSSKGTHDEGQSSEDQDKKAFPYPLSQAHPQSSSYPLSYPLGFDNSGPVLLTPAKKGKEEGQTSEGAVGAFERYNDESGLSAQEELRLLKAQVQDIARVCKAVAFGDLSQHITVPVQGHVMVELKDIINQMVDRLSNFAAEVTRVSLEVGTQGKLGGQVEVEGVEGRWKELKDVVNRLAENLTNQVRGVALVTKAVARGDLSKKIDVQADGEILDLKVTINVMVDQLKQFANEVTRVSREVGSRGQLGGQANVPGVEGVWEELTINVSFSFYYASR